MALNYQNSQADIRVAERKYQEKKQQLKDIEYEVNLYELNAYNTYKANLIYEWFIFSNTIDQARKWLKMLASGEKIDKRKKYEEKAAFDDVTKRLKEMLDQPDIEITRFWINGFHHCSNIIDFTCQGHTFAIDIPIVVNVTLDDYKHYGESAFQIVLRNYEGEYCSEWIGSTFEESELKDILNKYLQENSVETK